MISCFGNIEMFNFGRKLDYSQAQASGSYNSTFPLPPSPQLAEASGRVSELQREVVVLQTQLEEARRKESGLSEALSTARQAMELYQKATQQDVSAGAGCMQLCMYMYCSYHCSCFVYGSSGYYNLYVKVCRLFVIRDPFITSVR